MDENAPVRESRLRRDVCRFGGAYPIAGEYFDRGFENALPGFKLLLVSITY